MARSAPLCRDTGGCRAHGWTFVGVLRGPTNVLEDCRSPGTRTPTRVPTMRPHHPRPYIGDSSIHPKNWTKNDQTDNRGVNTHDRPERTFETAVERFDRG